MTKEGGQIRSALRESSFTLPRPVGDDGFEPVASYRDRTFSMSTLDLTRLTQAMIIEWLGRGAVTPTGQYGGVPVEFVKILGGWRAEGSLKRLGTS